MVLIALYYKLDLQMTPIFIVHDDKLRQQLLAEIEQFRVDGTAFRITTIDQAMGDAGKSDVVVLLDEADAALKDEFLYTNGLIASGLYKF